MSELAFGVNTQLDQLRQEGGWKPRTPYPILFSDPWDLLVECPSPKPSLGHLFRAHTP